MNRVLSILILDDVAEDAHLIERAISREKITFVSRRVDSRAEYESALSEENFDVIVADHSLPQFNSIEALRMCRGLGMRVPFILVTGTVSEEFAVTCIKQGADDYVLKSNLSRLPPAILNAIERRRQESKRREAEQEIFKQNQQLVQANEMISKTNNELDNFVYSVSHNLRGPVCSMQGIINLAKEESEADKEHYWRMIASTVAQLEETIQEIMQYSYNSRNDVANESIDLAFILKSNFDKLKVRKLNSILEIETDGSVLCSDPYRMNIIIRNLLSNCLKFSDPSKSQHVIRATIKNENNCTRISISDNGIGIKKEVLPRIFNMFYRGSQLSDGAGLGLYIVKEAVDKLGGAVDIDTHEGIGTTVSLILPQKSKLKSA